MIKLLSVIGICLSLSVIAMIIFPYILAMTGPIALNFAFSFSVFHLVCGLLIVYMFIEFLKSINSNKNV